MRVLHAGSRLANKRVGFTPRQDAMPKVAVSSAWKEESAGPNAAEVQRFSTQLRAAGVEVDRKSVV